MLFLFTLSVYKLDGGGAMVTFEDWLPQVWLPEVQPLDGRRISEMLSSFTQPQLERYYKLRCDRACKHRGSAVTLSFDSTSISTSVSYTHLRAHETVLSRMPSSA